MLSFRADTFMQVVKVFFVRKKEKKKKKKEKVDEGCCDIRQFESFV